MSMSLKERLKDYIKSQSITIKDFERSLGMSNGYVNSISKGLGDEYMTRLIEKYPTLNIPWLLTGEGDMLIGDTNVSGNHSLGVNNGSVTHSFNSQLESSFLKAFEASQTQLTTTLAQLSTSQTQLINSQSQTTALIEQLAKSQQQISELINLLKDK
ncbi:hypothetical protein [uncultured Porphyromonas sp.]|uniref:hypothetical protein n=1 Tax=uncultured Porphyromonas sp. TaxID=159274 RepID=UPI00259B0D4B|nr:hypothetical protein [uncultured Porphyromonas sp.]